MVMTTRIEIYGPKHPHWLLRFGDLACNTSYLNFNFDEEGESKASYAVCAYRAGRIIGVLKVKQVNQHAIKSLCTWVAATHRRSGLATELWVTLLDQLKPDRVTGTVISDRGQTLITKLQVLYPASTFDFFDNGERKLRNLKQRRAA